MFMAPEVAVRDVHNRASDIWSFGGLMFEMVTGSLAFKSKTSRRLLLELAAGHTFLHPSRTVLCGFCKT